MNGVPGRFLAATGAAVAALAGIVVLVSSLAASGCAPRKALHTYPPPADLLRPMVSHVLVVSVDGLRPDEISERHSPNIYRLTREGAYTPDAQTVTPSLTLPAHASMITGLPPERHKITWNSYRPDRGHLTKTTMFDVAREAGLKTAIFAGKEKLNQLMPPDAVDRYSVSPRGDLVVMREAIDHLRSDRPNLMLIHLPGVDRAGHFYGWKTAKQREALKEADEAVGRLLRAIDDLELRSSSVLLLTADHGGIGRHHQMHRDANKTIPYVFWGADIRPREIPAVSLMATAVIALQLLDVDLPRDWRNREAASPVIRTAADGAAP